MRCAICRFHNCTGISRSRRVIKLLCIFHDLFGTRCEYGSEGIRGNSLDFTQTDVARRAKQQKAKATLLPCAISRLPRSSRIGKSLSAISRSGRSGNCAEHIYFVVFAFVRCRSPTSLSTSPYVPLFCSWQKRHGAWAVHLRGGPLRVLLQGHEHEFGLLLLRSLW